MCVAGRTAGRAARRAQLERWLGLVNLFLWVMAHVYWMLPAQFDARTSLPLQLCHLAALATTASLLSERRIYRTLVYYWGLGLSTQALATPNLQEGPAVLWFWVFWQQHGIVAAVALYHLSVHGYRPTWRDFRMACAATLGYVCVIVPIDLAFGLNYGFLGPSQPEHPSIIDLLGPWPQRLLAIFAIVAAVMALMTWAWRPRGR
jgi:hypothetical integral membrane protein (TIGR02206 family)